MPNNQQLHTISKKQFIFGLHWQITGKSKVQLKKLAEEFDSQYFAQIKMESTDNQAGFVESKLSSLVRRKRTYSFAASVAKHYEQFPNLIAVFKIDEGIYSCVFTKENVIMPQGDLIGTQEEIKNAIIEMLSIIHDWDNIIAPDEFNLDAQESPDIESFVTDIKAISSHYKIRPVSVNYSKYLLAISLPFAVYFILGDTIQDAFISKPAPVVKPTLQRKPVISHPKVVYPWKDLVSNINFWSACQQPRISFIVPGWKFNQFACNRKSVSVRFSRLSGSILDIKHKFAPVFFSIDGQSAFWTQKLNVEQEESNETGVEELTELQEAYVRLNQLSQLHSFKLELSVEKNTPGIAGRADINGKGFEELKFNILSEILTPGQIIELIGVKGLYINEIIINEPGTWQIKGLQYVRK